MARLSLPNPPHVRFSIPDPSFICALRCSATAQTLYQPVCIFRNKTPLRLEKWRCQTVPDRIKFNKYRGRPIQMATASFWKIATIFPPSRSRDCSNMSLVYHPVFLFSGVTHQHTRISDHCQKCHLRSQQWNKITGYLEHFCLSPPSNVKNLSHLSPMTLTMFGQ